MRLFLIAALALSATSVFAQTGIPLPTVEPAGRHDRSELCIYYDPPAILNGPVLSFPSTAISTTGFETWTTPAEVNAATNAANAPFLETSKAYKATLVATPQVTFAAVPSKTLNPDSYAGLLLVHITDSGTYGVAASSDVWLGLIKDQTHLKAVGQGILPSCYDIPNIVLFDLQPGDYVLQIADSKTADVTVQVQPLP